MIHDLDADQKCGEKLVGGGQNCCIRCKGTSFFHTPPYYSNIKMGEGSLLSLCFMDIAYMDIICLW